MNGTGIVQILITILTSLLEARELCGYEGSALRQEKFNVLALKASTC
jgi:hypothetical protein